MRCDYLGQRPEVGRNKREACIIYHQEREQEIAEYIIETLEDSGYIVTQEDGFAYITVEDKNEFDDIYKIYKDVKERYM